MMKHLLISLLLGLFLLNSDLFAQPEPILQTGHSTRAWNLYLTPDEKHLLSQSSDRLIVWDVTSGRALNVLENETFVDLSADGRFFATSETNEIAVNVYEIKSGRQVQTIKNTDSCSFTLNDVSLVCKNDSSDIIIIDLEKKDTDYEIAFSDRSLQDFALGFDGRLIASSRVNLPKNAPQDAPRNFIDIYEKGRTEPSFTLTDKTKWGVSNDGRFLVAEDEENTVEVFDLSAKNRSVLKTSEPSDWKISPTGKFLSGMTEDKEFKIWNLADGKVKFSAPDQESINNFPLTADEKYLSTWEADGMQFYELEKGTKHLFIKGEEYAFELSPNGKFVLVSNESADRTVLSLWNLDEKKTVFSTPPTIGFRSKVFSADSRFLLLDFDDVTGPHLIMRDTATGNEKIIDLKDGAKSSDELPMLMDKIATIEEAPVPPPMSLVAITNPANIRTLPISLEQGNTMSGYNKFGETNVLVSQQNKTVIRVMENNAIALWSASSGKRVATFDSLLAPVTVKFGLDKTKLIVSDGLTEKFWDFQKGGFTLQKPVPQPKPTIGPAERFVSLYDVESDESEFAIVNKKTRRDFLRVKNVRNCEISRNYVYLACFKPSELSDSFFTLEMIDLRTKRTVFRVPNIFDEYYSSESVFGDDNQTLAFRTYDPKVSPDEAEGRLEIWSIRGVRLFASPYGIVNYSLTDDRKHALLEFNDRLEWHDLKTKKVKKFVAGDENLPIDADNKNLFPSPSGERLAITSFYNENRIYVWDASKDAIFWQTKHSATISGAVFSPNERLLLTGSDDGSIKVWDVPEGELLLTLLPVGKEDWIIFDPTGGFDFSTGAKNLFSWSFGDKMLFFEQMQTSEKTYLERNYKPGLWPKTLAGK